MAVDSGTLLDKRVDIRNCHKDSTLIIRQRFSHRELVEITRVIVIDGRPEQMA
jgi:hypothetical protein